MLRGARSGDALRGSQIWSSGFPPRRLCRYAMTSGPEPVRISSPRANRRALQKLERSACSMRIHAHDRAEQRDLMHRSYGPAVRQLARGD